MPNHANTYRWFRRIGQVTLVILKIILLFLEIVRRCLGLS